MDLPMEVFTLIILLISNEEELKSYPFLKNTVVKKSNKKNLTLISPSTLCKLSRVSKSFYTEFTNNTYWTPLMVRDFRDGKEYKRPHKNCHLKKC